MGEPLVAERGDHVKFRGHRLAVHVVGDGPTIGYLHGLVGHPDPPPLAERLASMGWRVVSPCLPGFNASDPCDDLRTIFDWVVATSEVLDVCGLAGSPMVASSIGAMLALEVAAVRPEAISRLVAVSPMGLWDDDDPVADPFGTTLSDQRALLTADPAATAWFFDDDRSLAADHLVEVGVQRYCTRTAAASLVWPICEFGLSTRAHRIACPVDLVWGAADRLNPPTYLDRYAAALAVTTAHPLIAGAGHLADLDAPSAVASVVGPAVERRQG